LTVLGHDAGIRRFWAHQFHFGFGENGYLGLQIGSHPNLTKIALFSIFGANGHFGRGGAGADIPTALDGQPLPETQPPRVRTQSPLIKRCTACTD
jgi:hypothetical protein